jgi:hypothetical protein
MSTTDDESQAGDTPSPPPADETPTGSDGPVAAADAVATEPSGSAGPTPTTEPAGAGESTSTESTSAGATEVPAPAEAEGEAEPAPAAATSTLAARRTGSASERRAAAAATPGWVKSAKRYGPFVAVAVIVVAAIAVFGGGSDDGDDDEQTSGTSGGEQTVDNDALVESGPMTWQKAEAAGTTDSVDWGDGCDTETGRIKLPTIYAPPCVEPFDGDNGGEIGQGVTADEITIVRYEADPAVDPVGSSLVAATGAEVNPETATQTALDYVDVYQQVFETYGRTVRVIPFTGTGASDDAEAARADAISIAEMKPFAVIGGPAQATTTYAPELASRGVVCIGTCAGSLPENIIEDNDPYLWLTGPTPNQAASLAAEVIGNLAAPGPAELAGDAETQAKDRVYAIVHYNTTDGVHTPVFEAMRDELSENGIDIETDVEYLLDPSRIQETARTLVARLESAGITTVIFYGDPLMPASLTTEATAQDYHPEWILGPNVLADTTIFGRSFDQEQWKNGFGIGYPAARGEPETSDDYRIYDWAYGTEPPNNTFNVIGPPIRTLFTGIQLAGPELTPETFRDGMYRYPPSGGIPTAAQISRGDHGVWPTFDWGGSDDATIVWWDPEATGDDETGQAGTGMYRYAKGGERYKIGDFPETAEEAGLFDVESSVTVYEEVPPEDVPPDYPPPNVG